MSEEVLRRNFALDRVKGECQTVEFKSNFPSNARELAEAIAAFATSNSGRIYLGVNDDSTLCGLAEVSNIGVSQARDAAQQRILGITSQITPRIRVSVDFLEEDRKVVSIITVPKGAEPVYYVGNIPYVRDLSSSRKATAEEVKELHLRYFQSAGFLEQPDEKQEFLFNLLTQMSDIQLALRDPDDHAVNPFLQQLLYDLGATARILSDLSLNPVAKKLGVVDELNDLSLKLEEMESYQFYLGEESWNGFISIGKQCLVIANRLYSQMKKHYAISEKLLVSFKELCIKNIEILKKEWGKSETYLDRGEIDRLKEELRILGYTFYRLGSIPEADKYNVSLKLRELGEKARKLSSMRYFQEGVGFNPVEEMKPEMEQALKLADEILEVIR